MTQTTETQRHGDLDRINVVTKQIIGCTIEVHRHLGPGLLESAYEEAMCCELHDQRMRYERQVLIPAVHKGHLVGEYRPDLIVEQAVVVEIKSIERLQPVFRAQILTYLRLTRLRVGLLLNFKTETLTKNIRRIIR